MISIYIILYIYSGQWRFMESNYHLRTELNLADPRSWFSGRNRVRADFTSPTSRKYQLECDVDNELQSSTPKVVILASFRTPESREYRLHTEADVQWLEGPYNMKITSNSQFTSPRGRQSEIEAEYKHQKSHSQREAYIQVNNIIYS